MKKIRAFLLAAVMLLGLMGCGSANPHPQQENFTFTYNGTQIMLNSEAAPIIAALGGPKSYTEETSCAFDGMDKTYYYGSFYLSTYPLNGKDYVYNLWFADDAVTTEEGICIGSPQSKVEESYGKESFDGVNSYVLTRDRSRLIILITDGLVSSVRYEVVLE